MSDGNEETYQFARDIKISQFPALNTLGSDAYLTFVKQGQNYKIPFAAFLSAIGYTGSLQQKGEVTGTPILVIDGANNYIRNLIQGAGILLSFSTEDGAKISHNFSAGNNGIPVLINSDQTSPVVRNLVAGVGMNIASSGNDIILENTGAVPAFNVVVVNQMNDFPSPVGGVITLGDKTAYLVSAELTTADRFVLGAGTVILGTDSSVSGLTYTGTEDMFTGSDVSAKITLLSLTCASGRLFNISCTTTGNVFQLVNCTIPDCDKAGIVTGLAAVQVVDVAYENITTTGVTFAGTCGLFISTRCLFTTDTATIFNLGTATFSYGFSLETVFSTITGAGTFLSGAVSNANFIGDGSGTVFNTRISGATAVPLSGISNKDAKWEFFGNNKIPNSINSLRAIKDNTLVTFLASNTPAIVGNTWNYAHESRFTGTVGGRFTYIGLGAHININATISALGTSVQTRDYEFLIYKNGVAVTNAVFSRSFSIGSSGSVSIVWEEDLETNDYIELWVQNTETTDPIEILNVIWSFS